MKVNEFSIEEGLHQAFNPKEKIIESIDMDIFSRYAAKSFAKKSLLSIASSVGKPIVVDKATQERVVHLVNDSGMMKIDVMCFSIRDATIDQAFSNSSKEATTFNSNNEENLGNKGKWIKVARRGVGKDGLLGSPNVVVVK
ncbi:hypothetical protein H5410_005077 [Solanum commersonii]|uniref:Uncharacterized protein n=1 Tax=Solanum commersonii TaxID=4109 RepID=A0A9J6A6E5_SOLCO|nr:hypothetical protein H5410_005077 [Solanum commersonii]